MGNIRTVILILAMIGPIMLSCARARAAAPDLHSPWGDDSDVLAPADALSTQGPAQAASGPAGPAASPSPPNPPSPPSPEDELRAVEQGQNTGWTQAPKEYDLAPAPSSSAPPPASMAGSSGAMTGRSVSPPRPAQRPFGQAVGPRTGAPLPVYLHIRARGEHE